MRCPGVIWMIILLVTVMSAMVIMNIFSTDEFDFDDLSGMNVLITGASSGIGEEMAYLYARHGANVVITARREERLKKVVQRCSDLSPNRASFKYIVADMAIKDEPKRVIAEATTYLPELNHLILNHAILSESNVGFWHRIKDNLEMHEKVIQINYMSHVYLATYAMPHLRSTNGSIGIVGSVAGKQLTAPCMTSYGTSKAALGSFFNNLAWEHKLAGVNISITHFALGGVWTDLPQNVITAYTKIFPSSEEIEIPYATANETAQYIIKSVTRRETESFYPPKQMHYFMNILRVIDPTWYEAIVESSMNL